MAIKTKKVSELVALDTLAPSDDVLVSDASGLKKIKKNKMGFTTTEDLNVVRKSIQTNETRLGAIDTEVRKQDMKIADLNRSLNKIQDQITDVHGDSWRVVQTNLGLGKRNSLYPIGTQFSVHNSVLNADLIMEVVDYPKDGSQDMILESVKCFYGYPMDNPEAMYIAKQVMPAGTYHFLATKPYEENQDHPLGSNQSYQFTTTQPIPVGGIIMMNAGWQRPLVENKIETWKDNLKSAKIETCTLSVGTGGTDLGTTDGLGELNHIDRFRFGNNNIQTSNLRQFLNAKGASWWKPQSKWDVAPSYRTKDGLLGGFPADFQAALADTVTTVATNTIFEEPEFTKNSKYTITDKVFLPTMTNMGFGVNNNVSEGTVWDKYKSASNADRIKYDAGGTARYYWMYSPSPCIAIHVRNVATTGSLSYYIACTENGFAPACKIKAI